MKPIPRYLKAIVENQARKDYGAFYHKIHSRCCLEDFEQESYTVLFKCGLWDSEEGGLIRTVARRAAQDLCRRMIWGFRRRHCYIENSMDMIDYEKEACQIFTSKYYEIMALQELLGKIDPVKQWIIKELIIGRRMKNIGRDLGVTMSRISQIRIEIIDRLYKINSRDEAKLQPD